MTRFQIKVFDTEAVVFDTASGDTHYLKPLALTLFQACQENPGLTSGGITQALAQRLSVKMNPGFSQQADDALSSLNRIGLLETP